MIFTGVDYSVRAVPALQAFVWGPIVWLS